MKKLLAELPKRKRISWLSIAGKSLLALLVAILLFTFGMAMWGGRLVTSKGVSGGSNRRSGGRTKLTETKIKAGDYSEEIADGMVARYDRGIRATKQKLVSGLLSGIEGKKVLDIGAGVGIFSVLCSELGAEVIATDFSPSMVRRIRERYGDRFDVLECETTPLPFCSNHFDVVLLLDVIEHLYKVEETISEIRRVLKPGGKLIITTPKRGFSINNFHRVISKELYLRVKKPFIFEVHLFKPSELINIVYAKGFRLKRFDTFLNTASYGIRGRIIEKLMNNRLRKFKWSSAIYLFCCSSSTEQ